MTTRPRAPHTLVALAALAALALSGCTGQDPTPSPDGTPTGSSSTASATPSGPVLKDRSAEVLDATVPLESVATTKARSSSTFRGSTFVIHSLTRNGASALLEWSVTGGPGTNSNDANVAFWANYPVLLSGSKRYSVVTFEGKLNGWAAVSNPFLPLREGITSPPQTALYPPLPEGTTEVTLQGDWFEDVKVPVTTAP